MKLTQARHSAILILLSLLLCVSALLFACGTDEQHKTLTVYSDDYPGLTSLAEVSWEEYEKEELSQWYDPHYRHHNHGCYVTVKDGNLIVSDTIPDSMIKTFFGRSGYFFGVSMHVYDGWVRYSPYRDYEFTDRQVLITNHHCEGFVEIDDQNAFLMTFNEYALTEEEREASGSLYRLTYVGGDDPTQWWKWEVIATFPERPKTGYYDHETKLLYLVVYNRRKGNDCLYSVTEDGTITRILEATWLFDLQPFSMVKQGNSIFFGSQPGILEYRLHTVEEHWYQMDYDAYYGA